MSFQALLFTFPFLSPPVPLPVRQYFYDFSTNLLTQEEHFICIFFSRISSSLQIADGIQLLLFPHVWIIHSFIHEAMKFLRRSFISFHFISFQSVMNENQYEKNVIAYLNHLATDILCNTCPIPIGFLNVGIS